MTLVDSLPQPMGPKFPWQEEQPVDAKFPCQKKQPVDPKFPWQEEQPVDANATWTTKEHGVKTKTRKWLLVKRRSKLRKDGWLPAAHDVHHQIDVWSDYQRFGQEDHGHMFGNPTREVHRFLAQGALNLWEKKKERVEQQRDSFVGYFIQEDKHTFHD